MRRSLPAGIACTATLMLSLCFPVVAAAEELSFVPTIVTTSGELEIDTSWQDNEFSQNARRSTSSALFLSEKLILAADGYIYHPRFNVFLIRLLPALNQWDTQGTGPSGSSASSSSGKATLDYEFRTTFLPEHPYNLELFTLHQEAASAQNFWKGQQGDISTNGAIFTYKDYPFILHASYNDSNVDSATNQTDTVVYRANATLRGDIMNQTVSYLHSNMTNAVQSRLTGEEYSYANAISYSSLQLFSRLSDRTTDQTALPDRSQHTDSFLWSEQLTSPLPWNFSTDLSFLYTDQDDSTATSTTFNDEFNRTTSYSVHLTHQLYKSLVSNFVLGRLDITSSLGEVTNNWWSVSEAYTKLIPTGHLLISAQYGKSTSEQSGSVTIINEPHTAPLLGSFLLNSQNIAPGTISIEVRDPPTGLWLSLPPANYVVTQVGKSFQITILNVAPATPQPNPLFVYDFRASYSLVNDSKIDMTTWGYGVEADLVRNLLLGYYQFSRSEQDTVSGSLAGGNDVLVSNTLGLRAYRGTVSGYLEYQTVRSRYTPYDAWRARVQDRRALADEVYLTLQASTDRYDYFATPTSMAYQSTISGLDVGLDYRIPSVNLMLYVTTSYYATRSVIDSDTLTLNTYATWQKGLLSITGGVQISAIDTTYATGRTSNYGDYVYLNLNRKLF